MLRYARRFQEDLEIVLPGWDQDDEGDESSGSDTQHQLTDNTTEGGDTAESEGSLSQTHSTPLDTEEFGNPTVEDAPSEPLQNTAGPPPPHDLQQHEVVNLRRRQLWLTDTLNRSTALIHRLRVERNVLRGDTDRMRGAYLAPQEIDNHLIEEQNEEDQGPIFRVGLTVSAHHHRLHVPDLMALALKVATVLVWLLLVLLVLYGCWVWCNWEEFAYAADRRRQLYGEGSGYW